MAAEAITEPATAVRQGARKKIVKRRTGDYSQRLRRAVQLVFLALNVWIGVEFYLFVRFYETAGQTVWAQRPPGVEGWLPIAGLMNLKSYLLTGQVPVVHPAGMFLLLSFLAIAFLFRKAFCSWLCPIGTVSEMLWRLGRQTFRRNFRLPRWADIPLRGLKYILLGLFLYAVGGMSVAAIHAFLEGPYGVIADVKMLNFFRFLGVTGAAVVAAAGPALGLHTELLVPVSVPVRRAAGIARSAQPASDPAGGEPVHRLREVREGVPGPAARG